MQINIFKDKKILLILGLIIFAVYFGSTATMFDLSSSVQPKMYSSVGVSKYSFYDYTLDITVQNGMNAIIGCKPYPTSKTICSVSLSSKDSNGCQLYNVQYRNSDYVCTGKTYWNGQRMIYQTCSWVNTCQTQSSIYGGLQSGNVPGCYFSAELKKNGLLIKKANMSNKGFSYDAGSFVFSFGDTQTNDLGNCELVSGQIRFTPTDKINLSITSDGKQFSVQIENKFMLFSAIPCIEYDLGILDAKSEVCAQKFNYPLGSTAESFPLSFNKSISDVKVRFYLKDVSVLSPLGFKLDYRTNLPVDLVLGNIYSDPISINVGSSNYASSQQTVHNNNSTISYVYVIIGLIILFIIGKKLRWF